MSRIIAFIGILFFSLMSRVTLAQSLPEKSPSRDDVFIMVDKMPEFPGGKDAMQKFISKEIKYPEEAIEEHIDGRVLLLVIIDKTGKVKDIISKGSPDKILEREAIRVVKLMPNWSPGIQKDIAVNVQVSIPVIFKLNQ